MKTAMQRAQEGGWTLFHCNVLAFLYKLVYSREAPFEAQVPAATVRRLMPFLPQDQVEQAGWVRHTFKAVG